MSVTNTVVAATMHDLVTLAEAKQYLGMNLTDTTEDAQLQLFITTNSHIIARECDRIFAKETIEETWREVYDGRVFLMHWPVVKTDITSVVAAGTGVTIDEYELEESSGKLSYVKVNDPASAPWPQSVIINYTGGYNLPDEAPYPLKHACILMVREDQIRQRQAQTAGIRQISHHEARVSFFDPNALLIRTAGMGSPAMQTVAKILYKYTRNWV
jgi:hypothetical protein